MTQSTLTTSRGRSTPLLRGSLLLLAVFLIREGPSAQTFTSGSDGTDGALVVPANAGTILFDPTDVARWGRVLDADGDGVYNFTTITIGAGTTLRIQGDKVNRPVYWLATGDIVIASGAALNASGADGRSTGLDQRRQVAVPGPGGYAGGAGACSGAPRTAGEGPGGGSGGGSCNFGCGVFPQCGNPGNFSGNRYLISLVGGSGGEGANGNDSSCRGGGAGGGAILLASSTTINVSGSILANGGSVTSSCSSGAGAGSGGGIRLVAPNIAGSGSLQASGGNASLGDKVGGAGWIRLEGYSVSTSLSFGPNSTVVTRGAPLGSVTLRPASSLRVTAIDGMAIAANPTGSFQLPDVAISKTGPVSVDIQASGIPPGTVVTLQVYSETPSDPSGINLTAQTTLAGTLESSAATAQFTFPFGFSRGWVRATWTQ
jgi:hypothetical protein